MSVQYGLVIDKRRCIGCQTCTVACKMTNNVPDGIFWTRAMTEGGEYMDTPGGVWPNLKMSFITLSCQHCANPACVKVCPVGATWKDSETGVVRQDYDKCIGCRMCMAACPYTGVRSFNWEEPKTSMPHAVGDRDVPVHQKHTVEKCTFCWQRISVGKVPACVSGCTTMARYFGDLNDPESKVSKLIATRQWEQLLPEKGTRPSVYYLV